MGSVLMKFASSRTYSICHRSPSTGAKHPSSASIPAAFRSILLQPWEPDNVSWFLVACNNLNIVKCSHSSSKFVQAHLPTEIATGWGATKTTHLSITEDEQPWSLGSAAQELQRQWKYPGGPLGLKQINQESYWRPHPLGKINTKLLYAHFSKSHDHWLAAFWIKF